MSIENVSIFKNYEQAQQYVEDVREHYRLKHAEYKGNHTEHQQLIAEVTSDEARLIIDGVMAGMLALGSSTLPTDYESRVERGGFSWGDFRGEYEKMLVGFGVITNRLHRDGYDVPEYADLGASDRMKAASVLLSDFLSHNALRFGVDSAGVATTERKTVHTEDGGIETISIITDKDKAKNDRILDINMEERGYRTGFAAHQALKISPSEYIKLRKEFSVMAKKDFDSAVSSYRNVREELESREA